MNSADSIAAITVNTTEEHIRRGMRLNGVHCPIALAIKESTHCSRVGVGIKHVAISNAGTIEVYSLPDAAVKFVRDFDMGITVTPFRFVMFRSQSLSTDDLL
jgi:hypothetical protein